jgi:hypothetical protein
MKSPCSIKMACILATVAVLAATAACDSSGKTLGISNNQGAAGTSGSDCSGQPLVKAVSLAGASFQTCSGSIAEQRFTNALCTCNDARIDGYLKTRGFDSERDPDGTNNGGAAVSINNVYTNLALSAAAYTDVFGSLAISGSAPSTYYGYMKVAGDLRTTGAVTEFGYINVARDTWSAGDLICMGYTAVGRDAHYAAGFPVVATVGGKLLNEAVRVDQMCPCGPADVLDVAAIVADGKAHNDNQAAGIDPTLFNAVVGTVEATLPCGRIYVEQITVVGELVLNVTGPTALFVGGSVDILGSIQVNLAPQATIDIFVTNTLGLVGRAAFGDEKRPAASRIYVGGEDAIALTTYETFVGNLYAPRARVAAPVYIRVLGAVVARDFEVPGYAQFTYDRAVNRAGDGCKAAPISACTKCSGCTGGAACVDGSCKSCSKDSDCCSQMGCNAGTGKCEPLQVAF